VLGVCPGYLVISHWLAATAQKTVALPIDAAIPLVPEWGYVYNSVYFLAFVPIFVVRHRELYRRVIAGALLVEVVSFAVFVLFPVRMHLRPVDYPSATFADWALRVLIFADAPSGCFPSLHVSMATLAALSCARVDRAVGLACAALAAAISVSTLFLKQHFLLDVVAGAAMGAIVYRVLVAPVDLRDTPAAERRFPRRWALAPAAAYGLCIVALFAAFQADWRPWSRKTARTLGARAVSDCEVSSFL
jgi:membrane-associated phospholipid phosphatase